MSIWWGSKSASKADQQQSQDRQTSFRDANNSASIIGGRAGPSASSAPTATRQTSLGPPSPSDFRTGSAPRLSPAIPVISPANSSSAMTSSGTMQANGAVGSSNSSNASLSEDISLMRALIDMLRRENKMNQEELRKLIRESHEHRSNNDVDGSKAQETVGSKAQDYTSRGVEVEVLPALEKLKEELAAENRRMMKEFMEDIKTSFSAISSSSPPPAAASTLSPQEFSSFASSISTSVSQMRSEMNDLRAAVEVSGKKMDSLVSTTQETPNSPQSSGKLVNSGEGDKLYHLVRDEISRSHVNLKDDILKHLKAADKSKSAQSQPQQTAAEPSSSIGATALRPEDIIAAVREVESNLADAQKGFSLQSEELKERLEKVIAWQQRQEVDKQKGDGVTIASKSIQDHHQVTPEDLAAAVMSGHPALLSSIDKSVSQFSVRLEDLLKRTVESAELTSSEHAKETASKLAALTEQLNAGIGSLSEQISHISSDMTSFESKIQASTTTASLGSSSMSRDLTNSSHSVELKSIESKVSDTAEGVNYLRAVYRSPNDAIEAFSMKFVSHLEQKFAEADEKGEALRQQISGLQQRFQEELSQLRSRMEMEFQAVRGQAPTQRWTNISPDNHSQATTGEDETVIKQDFARGDAVVLAPSPSPKSQLDLTNLSSAPSPSPLSSPSPVSGFPSSGLQVFPSPLNNTQLRDILSPTDFDDYITKQILEVSQNTRQWVISDVKKWMDSVETPQFMGLVAGTTFGKSALCCRLIRQYQQNIVGYHFIQHEDCAASSPGQIIRTLSYQLSRRIPEYKAVLDGMNLEAVLQDTNVLDLFNNLLRNPLGRLPDSCDKLVVIIDGINEGHVNGQNLVLKMILALFRKLPRWLGFLITSRQQQDVSSGLKKLGAFELSGDDPRNNQDIEQYISSLIAEYIPENERRRGVEILRAKSKDSMLYLSHFVVNWMAEYSHTKDRSVDLNLLQSFPDGLDGAFTYEFKKLFSGKNLKLWESSRMLLSLIAAADVSGKYPIPEFVANDVIGWNEATHQSVSTLLSGFVFIKYGRYRLFHRSLMEWLINANPNKDQFYVDLREGSKRLGEVSSSRSRQGSRKSMRYSFSGPISGLGH